MAETRKAATPDEFLAGVPEPAHGALQQLRTTIRSTIPDAVEVINYGVPMFRLGGRNLVSYAAARSHCSFFVQSPKVMQAFAAELEDFATSRGTIRFQPGKPIPAALVQKIVKARVQENAAPGS